MEWYKDSCSCTEKEMFETEQTLKPCPCCNKNVRFRKDESGAYHGPIVYWVECYCGLQTEQFNDPLEAIKLWNTRV